MHPDVEDTIQRLLERQMRFVKIEREDVEQELRCHALILLKQNTDVDLTRELLRYLRRMNKQEQKRVAGLVYGIQEG